jgi:hypothetical protein
MGFLRLRYHFYLVVLENEKGKKKPKVVAWFGEYLSIMAVTIICLVVVAAISVYLVIYRDKRKEQPIVINKVAANDSEQTSGNPAICSLCGKMAKFIPPTKSINDDQVESTFECPDGHIYTMILPIK